MLDTPEIQIDSGAIQKKNDLRKASGGTAMNLRHLRYFARIVELGSISQAATDLGVAQPALSKSIMALEHTFGARLIDRSSRGVTATEAGRRLYDHCQIVFSQLARALGEVAESGNTPAGLVNIGMPNSIANVLLVRLLRAASETLPKVRLQVFQEPRLSLPDRIQSGRIDFGLIVYPSSSAGLRQMPLLTEELVFVSYPELKLGPGPISPNAIARIPLIMPTRENRLRLFVESLFLVHSLALDVRFEVDAIGHFVDCVEAGLGATILPSSSILPMLATRRVRVHSIADPAFRRTVSFASADTRPMGLAVAQSAALLRDTIKAVVAAGEWPGARPLK